MKTVLSLALILVFIGFLIVYFDMKHGIIKHDPRVVAVGDGSATEIPREPASAEQLPTAAMETPQAADPTELSFRNSIHCLPLRDPRIAVFARDWPEEMNGARFHNVFNDAILSNSTSITETHEKEQRILRLDVDTGLSYCGWMHKLLQADWSEYRDCDLVLRVRFSEAMLCKFNVQLKPVGGPASGNAPRLNHEIDLKEGDIAEMRRRGFGDILIPLSSGSGEGTLKGLDELVLLFDAKNTKNVSGKPRKGELSLHSIRLAESRKPEAAASADELLDELAGCAFEWFEHYRNEKSGLVPDRAPNYRSLLLPAKPTGPCSIASVGYYLSMLPDAAETGRLTRAEATERALQALRFLETHAEHREGLFYHFINLETGKAKPGSEVSLLDSAILFNGCMVIAEYCGGEAAAVANRLIERANWTSYRRTAADGRGELLTMAWDARRGLHGPMDVRSSEFAMPYFLAIGSAEHGVSPKLWWNTKVNRGMVEGQTILNPSHSLFTSYYGLGWHPLKGLVDRDKVDLYENARAAAQANHAFCAGSRETTYQGRWGGWWGISAGDSPRGYIAPGPLRKDAGGTVWPTAALAALPWFKDEIDADIVKWANSPVWPYVAGPFGLAPFNLEENWVGKDLIGIDLGSFYLAVANQRRGTVWGLWKKHPVGKRALERIYGKGEGEI